MHPDQLGRGVGRRSLLAFGVLFAITVPLAYLEGLRQGIPILHTGFGVLFLLILLNGWDAFLIRYKQEGGLEPKKEYNKW